MKITKYSRIIMPCLSIFLALSGCKSYPSAKYKNPEYISMKTNSPNQLTYSDVFDDELENEITEDDIQDAISQAEDEFTLTTNSPVILVQSGQIVPDIKMQNEMSKYYQISVYSGIPKKKTRMIKKEQEEPIVQNNYMRTLRLIAAKGHQKAIIVYWSTLQTGITDNTSREIIWKDYDGGAFPAHTTTMRYLLRFALVDVNTGNWSMYLPVTQTADYQKTGAFNDNTGDIAQIESLKQRVYAEAAHNLSDNYRKTRLPQKS